MNRLGWMMMMWLGAADLAAAADGSAVARQIAAAKPGETVTLPAGELTVGEVAVPAQVKVRGAGWDKTILTGSLKLTGSGTVTISDLTVQRAPGAALHIAGGAAVTLECVRARESGVGVLVADAIAVRVANCLVIGNRVGVVLRGATKSVVVNCTLQNNSELAVSLVGNKDCAVFNNLVLESQTGVFASPDNDALALDHNLYIAQFVGATSSEPARESLPSWRSRFGYDRHSVELKVALDEQYRPVTPLPWALDKTTASGWGVRELAGFAAPSTDLGAIPPAKLTPPRPADGQFTVTKGQNVSAGLFTPGGRNVAWLFHNLPVPKGTHNFWLPPGVPAGEYELRVVESDLGLRYVTALGSIGADNTLENSNAIDPTLVLFDPQDNLVLFQGGAEDHTHVRSFAPGLQQARWRLSGNGGATGATVDEQGQLVFLRADGTLFRVNAATGAGLARESLATRFTTNTAGLAVWHGKLYVADPVQNKLLTRDSEIALPKPRWPAVDTQNDLLWVLSGDQVVALDTAGKPQHQLALVPQPTALAVNHGRLAVFSAADKQVHVFDLKKPGQPQSLVRFGAEHLTTNVTALTINSTGEVVVLADGAPHLFRADGTFVRAPQPMWGQFVACGWWTGATGKPELHVTGMHQRRTLVMDFEKSSWRPGRRFSLPEGVTGTIAAFFTEGGHNYLAITEDKAPAQRWVVRVGADGHGAIAAAFAADQPVQFLTDGQLLSKGAIVPRSVTANGDLAYDFARLTPTAQGVMPAAGQGHFNGAFLPDSAWVMAGGPSRGFGGGFTLLQALDKAGGTNWEHRLDYHSTIGAFRSVRVLPGVVLAMATEELDTAFVSPDGLGLGVVGPAADFRWSGYWHDQDWSLRTLVGPGGQRYLLLGDYVRHTAHWLELTGVDAVTRAKVPVVVRQGTAGEVKPVHNPAPASPRVVVRKLAAALPVDGDPAKWRALDIAPQILVIPPGVSPTNCSAVIRCAWHGDDLYFQVIKFDDVVTMHQPLNFHYKQDSTEVALVGGFMGGYKFAITRTTDHGDVLYREQFLMKKELNLDVKLAPRVIQVLPRAESLPERQLIESVTGADLAGCQAIITEFKIPMSHAWDGKSPIPMASGTEFWLGWFIDDNDTPGLDEQRAYPWPVTFQAFGNPDQGARAVLE